jgi:uncharacterized protein YyaL (SSP411 family)
MRWAEWRPEVFVQARREGKPVLLSLTARWCHACHRMEEETWEDPGVAAQVERLTVPVRVDADARPDLYARYHLGGLPTTALLTPDGDFIRGGTFLAPPQFWAWLDSALADFAAGKRPAARANPPRAASGPLVDAVVTRLLRRADPEHGGFGAAPKLPEPHAIALLLRRWRATRDEALRRTAAAALDAVLQHLYDAHEGGFFRYAAGMDWSGPHTEKVSVDQAELCRLFLEAGAALGDARYVLAAGHSLAFLRARLSDGEGRIFSSLAAAPGYYAAPARDPERRPPVDSRRFADASAAAAMAAALLLAVTGEEMGFAHEYRAAAPSGCIPHRLDAAEGPAGLLRDQALGIAAAVDGYRLTGEAAWLDWARRAAEWTIATLWDDSATAFLAAPAGEEPWLPPMFPLVGNGEMAWALAALADHAGEAALREYARRAVEGLSAAALRSPAGPALALAALRLKEKPAEAELEAAPADPRARALARVALAALGPATVVRWKPGRSAALTLCAGDMCLPPLGEAAEILESLEDLGLAAGGIISVG